MRSLRSVAGRVRREMDPRDNLTLVGRCGEACESIAQTLAFEEGHDDVTIVGNDSHEFVYCNEYFIDVTLTQFYRWVQSITIVYKMNYDKWLWNCSEWEITHAEAIYRDGTRNIIYEETDNATY